MGKAEHSVRFAPDVKVIESGSAGERLASPLGISNLATGLISTDGHTELMTKHDLCALPKVSKKGDVGWSVWNDLTHSDNPHDSYHHTAETLRLRLRDGTTKDFKPNSLFIMDWGFEDDSSTVVIQSMAHHGHAYFIKYDIASGRELGRLDEYVPYDQKPKWAQPYADDKP